MEEMEIVTEAANRLPLWANVVIGIVVSFGGLEFIKYLVDLFVNWRANKRKNSAEAKESEAEAKQQEATAGQQDAELRQKELDLLNQIVETTKQQYGELKERYDELLTERKSDRAEMNALRKEVAELRIWKAEQERKTEGLQRAFTESESRRISAERYYCAVEGCTLREPPLGTYDSSKVIPRRKNGQFAKKNEESLQN